MYNIISKRKIWYAISAIMIIPGILSLLFNGLNLGIDFTGGTLIEVQMDDQENINTEDVRDSLAHLNLGNLVIQSSGDNSVIIRTDTLAVDEESLDIKDTEENDVTTTNEESDNTEATETSFLVNKAFAQSQETPINDDPLQMSSEENNEISSEEIGESEEVPPLEEIISEVEYNEMPEVTVEGEEALIVPISENIDAIETLEERKILGGTEKFNQIIEALQEKFGTITELRFEAIGPTISSELTSNTIWAIFLASLFIILYLAWAFRNVPAPASSWRFGICAIAALLHDVIFILGFYSILGAYYNIELDILFLPAILTIMSFSVHDSIVVFDRVRENLRKYTKESFEEVVNISVNETLVRSLNLSLTVIITLLALYLFGAPSLKQFILTLIIGLISGTYSSIFNASPLLVTWHKWASKK